ncbi:NB-ARC domain-containing protein [Armatimonas rosea]|uniref:Non-specific serine/threonine protein kinase n=1 Tax=Armatimonas rosea TaxID=685828 RepID=A0A7W9SRL3_ARMRO|nr:non-specific serine/threonine protein kinase [Armatimonas rosea]
MYQIELKDGVRVRYEAVTVEKFRTQKAVRLLAYLAFHPGMHSRDRLLELFWPELELDSARNGLSAALGHLRVPLEDDLGQRRGSLIRATRDYVGLLPGSFTTDFDTIQDPERFLPGYYDDWVLEVREKLQAQLRRVTRPEPRAAVPTPEDLPADITPYLGREALREEVRTVLAQTRLLTLVGPGGIGKTRLALETLRSQVATGARVAWVELSSLTDPSGIPARIAGALGLKSVEALMPALRQGPVLLGLDNCEHLILGVARETESLLKACPQLTVLATSREPLTLVGESVLRLPSLTEDEAIALFCDRAQRAQRGWQLTPEQRPLLTQLWRALDGLPLALELAAAKLRTLPLPELVARLEARLAVLTSGSRSAEPRQQTLRAAIAWSYELLTPEERLLAVRLAVFQGGWSLALAEAVCGGEGILEESLAALLDSLVDKSLVHLDSVHETTRYRFLETVHEFLRGQLAALPTPEQNRLHHAHFETLFALAAAYPGRDVEPQRLWARHLDQEGDNTRQALAFCYDHAQEQALVFCNNLRMYWHLRGFFQEARQQYELALALPGAQAPTEDRVTALRELSNSYQGLGDWAAAEAVLDRLAELNLALGQPLDSQTCRAMLAFNQGDLDRSRRLFEEVLAYARTKGTPAEREHATTNMMQLLMALGEYPAVHALLDDYRAHFNDPLVVTHNQALLDLLEGKILAARTGFHAVFPIHKDLESHRDIAYLIVQFGMLAYREGEPELAAQFFGASEAWCEHYGFIIEQPEFGFRENDLAELRRLLGDDAFAAPFAQGRALKPEHTLALMESRLSHRGTKP